MQKFVAVFLALLCWCNLALATEDEKFVGQGLYSRTDLLTKKETFRVWRVIVIQKKKEMRIEKHALSGLDEIETVTLSTRTSLSHKTKTYSKEVLFLSLSRLKSGEAGLGHVEVHDIKTNKLLEAWPMIYTISSAHGLHLAEFKIFKNNGAILLITRQFTNNQTITPISERKREISMLGETLYDVVDVYTK